MRLVPRILPIAILCVASPVAAQAVQSEVTASNGVKVTVYTDEFAGRREYTAPSISIDAADGGNGGLLVAKLFRNGRLGKTDFQGFMVYSGPWRNYSSALFKGGEPAKFVSDEKKVGDCRGGCTLTESFSLELTQAELTKHAENGIVAVQIRGGATSTARVNIPLSYVAAINEVAK